MTTMNTRAATPGGRGPAVAVTICDTPASADGRGVAEPCTGCGHTGLVHPGEHNPAVRECVLCRLLAAAMDPGDLSNLMRRPELNSPSDDPDGREE